MFQLRDVLSTTFLKFVPIGLSSLALLRDRHAILRDTLSALTCRYIAQHGADAFFTSVLKLGDNTETPRHPALRSSIDQYKRKGARQAGAPFRDGHACMSVRRAVRLGRGTGRGTLISVRARHAVGVVGIAVRRGRRSTGASRARRCRAGCGRRACAGCSCTGRACPGRACTG